MILPNMRWLPNGLTQRQWDVWKLLSRGNTNWEIGDRLNERHGVIIYDIGQLYTKLRVPDGVGARSKLANMFPVFPQEYNVT